MLYALAAATTDTGFNITRAAAIVAACSASFVAILNAINTRRTTSYQQLLKDIKDTLRDVIDEEIDDVEEAIDRLRDALDRVIDRLDRRR